LARDQSNVVGAGVVAVGVEVDALVVALTDVGGMYAAGVPHEANPASRRR